MDKTFTPSYSPSQITYVETEAVGFSASASTEKGPFPLPASASTSLFEMLSWPHRTPANIINICFWLLETCTKSSYFVEENIRPSAQRLAFEVKYKCIVRRPRMYHGPAACTWASFQTTGAWCVKNVKLRMQWYYKLRRHSGRYARSS